MLKNSLPTAITVASVALVAAMVLALEHWYGFFG